MSTEMVKWSTILTQNARNATNWYIIKKERDLGPEQQECGMAKLSKP
jgi:hypothetical protein